jgi:hypothetical protein
MPGELMDADLEYRCPRCGTEARERFYGPCAACRQELVASLGTDTGGGAQRVAAERFEPGLNVVPNHVATKD